MNEEYIPVGSRSDMVIRELYDWFESGLTAVLCVVLAFTFVGRVIGVVGISMFPTLHDKDRLIATPIYSQLEPGDIVVVAMPNIKNNEPLIKRVIAVGGQTISIDGETGEITINGRRILENYETDPIAPGSKFEVEFPQTVPEGHIFIMGDNRNQSWDSRVKEVGMVDERYVLGKVVYRVTPYERFGPPDKSRGNSNANP